MTKVRVIIPFRDRGNDPRRQENLDYVLAWWWFHDVDASIVSDGLKGDEQFNRHRAYNNAVRRFPETDVFVFTEADMLLPVEQVQCAISDAAEKMGLVVPFTEYRYLSPATTDVLHEAYDGYTEATARLWSENTNSPKSVFSLKPEKVMRNGRSIGAVNVLSRETIDAVGGWTEATSGNWYDDNIMEEGIAYLTGSGTRWVNGPAVHLYHKPGWEGDHLSDSDRAATAKNKRILHDMRRKIKDNDRAGVEQLMAHREEAR